MSEINDGGPAFPIPGHHNSLREPEGYVGMSLRDWFAGQAMAGGLCRTALGDNDARWFFGERVVITRWESAVADAYAYADAMLKARSKEPR